MPPPAPMKPQIIPMTTPQTIAYLLQLDYWLRHYHVQIV